MSARRAICTPAEPTVAGPKRLEEAPHAASQARPAEDRHHAVAVSASPADQRGLQERPRSARPRRPHARSRCLNDLLYRHSIGALKAELVAVVSNHRDFEGLARSSGIDFHYLPITAETKDAQEAKLRTLVDELQVDLVVLARYMQILTEPTVEQLTGRAINIHHSFLPSFKGASPYRQAYERGVKVIGATAHYVTSKLDEGPIIEQEVARVDHAHSPEQMAEVGRDIECVTLARAVRWHIEHRVMLSGRRTIIFK